MLTLLECYEPAPESNIDALVSRIAFDVGVLKTLRDRLTC